MRKLLTLVVLFTLFACQSESRNGTDAQNPLKAVELITPSGDVIQTTLAITPSEQEQGLSGVRPDNFSDNQGMLFFYLQDEDRHFWMPDTYFDLDLFYLDKDLKVIDIIRKLPFYIGRLNPELIPRARGVWCRHTLEMKATSPISQKIKLGDVLKWQGGLSLQESESLIRKKLGPN